jgi:hypothetical protein
MVRKATSRGAAEVGDWSMTAVHAGAGEGLGVYRLNGGGHDGPAALRWSLVLKVLGPQADGRTTSDWNFWRREADAYRSGVLAELPGDLATPRCLAVTDQPDGSVRLWLEEVLDDIGERWPLPRYAVAARHLGQLNGAYAAGRPRPAGPWMARRWLPAWVAANGPAVEQLRAFRDHPLVRLVLPSSEMQRLQRLWAEREPLLAALERLPRTFCHRDAFRRNLIARRTPGGGDQTIAIDWAFVGEGAIGEDVVPLITASLEFFEVEFADAQELEALVLDGYMQGLRDAGWHGDPAQVRYAFAAGSALRYALGTIRLVLPSLLDARNHRRLEELFSRPVAQVLEDWRVFYRYLLDHADKARAIAGE